MNENLIEQDDDVEVKSDLYMRDCDIIRKLGYGRKFGYRLLRRLEQGVPGMRKYPQIDPIFKKRFWPEVLQWHMDYHRVRRSAEQVESAKPGWQENFNGPPASPHKARGSGHARPQLATAR